MKLFKRFGSAFLGWDVIIVVSDLEWQMPFTTDITLIFFVLGVALRLVLPLHLICSKFYFIICIGTTSG